jgi:AraC-like DNA-binding protein
MNSYKWSERYKGRAMMENHFVNQGREFHPNYKMPLYYSTTEAFAFDDASRERFRIIFFEEGTGLLDVAGGKRFPFIAPALICLSETEEPQPAQAVIGTPRALFFHPRLINKKYTFESVREWNNFSDPEGVFYQDLIYLQPFIKRKAPFGGMVQLGPSAAQRVSELFNLIAQELEAQRDYSWTCRTRAYFLELLFLIARLHEAPDMAVTPQTLTEKAEETDPIILYIHSNYHRKLNIAELSQEFHLNRTTLLQRITKATGSSFLDYLTQLRMKIAVLILRETELPVTEVLNRVGFSDSTHFGRVFRKYTGFTPSDYRNHAKENLFHYMS